MLFIKISKMGLLSAERKGDTALIEKFGQLLENATESPNDNPSNASAVPNGNDPPDSEAAFGDSNGVRFDFSHFERVFKMMSSCPQAGEATSNQVADRDGDERDHRPRRGLPVVRRAAVASELREGPFSGSHCRSADRRGPMAARARWPVPTSAQWAPRSRRRHRCTMERKGWSCVAS